MWELFHLSLAIGPLAVYLIVIGWIRCRSRPLIVSGGKDTFTLSLGLIGVVAIGPMELFFPRAASSIFGPKVWLFLVMLYFLVVLLVILASRPRLIVYGLSAEDLKQHLQPLLNELDPHTRWLGDNVQLPTMGVSAIVEPAGPGSLSHLLAVSHRQHIPSWITIERQLAHRLKSVSSVGRPTGWIYLTAGLFAFGLILAAILRDPGNYMQSMREMLRL